MRSGPGPPTNAADAAAQSRFRHAKRLLSFMVRKAILRRTAAQAASELTRARLAVLEHEHEEERLRCAVGRHAPGMRGTAARALEDGPTHEVVRELLERAQRDFARPVRLRQVAQEFNVNADYLSTLFRSEVGVPFKWYVTMLRLQRAQELLGDPTRRVSEVAREVGYVAPRGFSAAFRSWTGLAPSRWRRSLRAH